MNLIVHLLIIIIGPIFFIGLINRTKAFWAGRKGPDLAQSFFDLRRLLSKAPVVSQVSSWIFQIAPWTFLSSSLIAAVICPLIPGFAPISFTGDFVFVAYLFALGRVCLVLAAMDTGSSFEAMGASREMTYASFIEPAFFFAVGTMVLVLDTSSLRELVSIGTQNWSLMMIVMRLGLVGALFVVLQIEAARVPVDDPATHLELTMIHEVMILDTSGPELAAIQYGSALKLVTIAGLIASLLNPFNSGPVSWVLSLVLLAVIAVWIGMVESIIARFRMRALPWYALFGVVGGLIATLIVVVSRWPV